MTATWFISLLLCLPCACDGKRDSGGHRCSPPRSAASRRTVILCSLVGAPARNSALDEYSSIAPVLTTDQSRTDSTSLAKAMADASVTNDHGKRDPLAVCVTRQKSSMTSTSSPIVLAWTINGPYSSPSI